MQKSVAKRVPMRIRNKESRRGRNRRGRCVIVDGFPMEGWCCSRPGWNMHETNAILVLYDTMCFFEDLVKMLESLLFAIVSPANAGQAWIKGYLDKVPK